MYQALYRKWRPRSFEDVAGQPQVTEILKNQVISGAVSHAYLFIGTRGTGKTTCAKILAKAVNCEAPEKGNPCNRCKACMGIDDGTIMDIVELDAASNNGVDNVRALRDEAIYSPAAVRKRVYIVDEVHMLSVSAFNALLKILEEPPEHLMFILATTELHKVPATILSRCQRYSFRRLPPETVAERLGYVAREEHLELTEEGALLLGRLAEGSMRDGLSILDQCAGRGRIDEALVRSVMGLAGGSHIGALHATIAAGDTGAALERFNALWQEGKDPATLLEELCALERDALLLSVAPKGGAELISGSFDEDTLHRAREAMPPARLLSDLEKIQETLGKLRSVQSPRTAAELCLISLCEPELGEGLAALRSRVERLERGLVPAAETPAAQRAAPQPREEKQPPASESPLPAPVSQPEDLPPWETEASHLPEEPPLPEAPPAEAWVSGEDSVPGASAAEPSDPGEDLWPRVLEEAKKGLDVGSFNMAADSASVVGVVKEELLELQYKVAFARMMLDKPEKLEVLRSAAERVTGRKLQIRMAEYKAAAPAAEQSSKLSELAKFGVKFE